MRQCGAVKLDPAYGGLAHLHRPDWTRLIAEKPTKEAGIALLASKRPHEDCRHQDGFKQSLCPRAMNQLTVAIGAADKHFDVPVICIPAGLALRSSAPGLSPSGGSWLELLLRFAGVEVSR